MSDKDEPAPRFLTDHQINPANKRLQIEAIGPVGAGGAPTCYCVRGHDEEGHPFFSKDGEWTAWQGDRFLPFQEGPVAADGSGTNGLTHEALLAVMIDRLQCFQAGPFACDENAIALACLRQAQQALAKRTRRREAAGIEGTHQKDPATT